MTHLTYDPRAFRRYSVRKTIAAGRASMIAAPSRPAWFGIAAAALTGAVFALVLF